MEPIQHVSQQGQIHCADMVFYIINISRVLLEQLSMYAM